MHIHRMNPLIESNEAFAAQRAEAQRERDAFKNKLPESIARLTADDQNCVLSINAQEHNPDGEAKQKNQQEKKQTEADAKQNDLSKHISDGV
jgi:hypothetical protein